MKKELPDITVLIDLYENQKLTATEIAKKYGYTYERILQVLRPHKVVRQKGKFRYEPIPKDVLIKLHIDEDLNISQIQKRLGVTAGRVIRSLGIAGIEKRRPKYHRMRYPVLGTLAVGESVDLPRPKSRTPATHFYMMAKKFGIRVRCKTINAEAMRVTRVE